MINIAVILAARKERDSEIPYPLIPIKQDGSTSILDRTIALLKKQGISNIILVTGYKAPLFEKYKEEGISLVYNANYKHTSSMASLALAEPFITEDFLLIESDVICEERVFEELLATNHRNCLTIVSESGNGDEALVETDDNVVIKISKDLHQLNSIDGEMIGISKISLDTFKRMMLKWERNENLKLNYEYLFLDCTDKHERQYIKPIDLVWCEVDNAKDFHYLQDSLYRKLRRKENPFNYYNIVSNLQDIFPDKKFGDNNLKVEFIGGMTNRNFKISFDGKSYVLRIPGNGTEGMIERKNEGKNTLLTYKMGITPEIYYINEDTGIKLTTFIEGAETMNSATIQRYEHMLQIADIFKTLHNSGVRLNNEFNVFHEIQVYEELMKKAGASMYEGYEKVRPGIMDLWNSLNDLGVDMKPCHNDLVPENFIKDKNGKIYLIDWEYSGMNDPMWDFAALFIESQFSEDNMHLVMERYLGHPADERVWTKIKIYQVLMDILWAIWTVVKEAQGDDFGDYGPMRFNRAIRQLNELKQTSK